MPPSKELETWLREHPPDQRGLKAHAAELRHLKALGYTQEQMRAWLDTQGLTVSRQAISKFILRSGATAAQPVATTGNSHAIARPPEATATQPTCNNTKSPCDAPQPAPAESHSLRERAQAVGDRYLQRTLSPLASRLMRKT